MKFDKDKPNCGLVYRGFAKALLEVAKVGTFGAKKYAPDSWKNIEQEAYVSALFRHLLAWLDGEKYDNESGFNHLSHCAWNALAICDMEINKPVEPSDIENDNEFQECIKLRKPYISVDGFSWNKLVVPSDIIKALQNIAYSGQCNNCDGCGYTEGCQDTNCAVYIANKALEKARGGK